MKNSTSFFMMKNHLVPIFCLSFLLSVCPAAAQVTIVSADSATIDSVQRSSASVNSVSLDSLSDAFVAIDSVQSDSALAPKQTPVKSDIDTTIYYDAMKIYTDVENRTTELVGKAVIKYKKVSLSAEKITLNWNETLMTAEPLPDTVWVKGDSTSVDSTMEITMKGKPVIIDGSSQMVGDMMFYNYKTEKARIVRGRTEMEGGFYTGEQIKRVNDNTFNIKNSSFTTCNLDTSPHFHFEAKKLKMVTNDKVIAKNIVMYMGNIPVAMLPFAVFPNKSGRQSGILIPRYGESAQEGRFLRGIGYYWAPSDYYDSNLQVDFFEKSGWLFRGGARYSVRYLLNGSLSGSYTKKTFGENKTQSWDCNLNHSQEIDPNSRLNINGSFVSDKNFYKNFSTNLSSRLTRQVRSNATYSKNWPKQKFSMSVNMSRVHDLQDDVTDLTMPQMTLRLGQSQLFKPSKSKARSKPGERRRNEPKWYESLYMSYNSNLVNNKKETLVTTAIDSATVTTKQEQKTRRISHKLDFSLTSPQKFFGILSVNQNLSFAEDWYDETQAYSYNPATKAIEASDKKGLAARHTFNYSASANTKFYGMFAPGIGDIQAIRHVVTPSLSFNYQPDFSDLKWGYYTEIKKPDGSTEKRDRFGGTGLGGSKRVNLSVSNLFQMKKGVGDKEKKIDLFNLNFGTGFNFEADRHKLSDLSTNWRADPGRNFSLSANTTHSFYQWQTLKSGAYTSGMRSNQYLFENDGWKRGRFLQMTSLQLNISVRLQGKENKDGRQKPAQDTDAGAIDREPDPLQEEEDLSVLEENLVKRGSRFEDQSRLNSLTIPWKTNINFSFSLNKSNPDKPQKNYYMNIQGAEMSLTKSWRLAYSAHYDLQKKQISYHSFTIYRDLHCWEATIDWVPSGLGKRVYAIVQIKSSVLRDIKLEKRGGSAASSTLRW